MKWINPETGQLERRPPGLLYSHLDEYNPFDPVVKSAGAALMEKERSRIPASIQRMLGKSARTPWDGEAVKASSVGWRDMLTPRRVLIADGAIISNVTTETIMVPDFTFAADYLEVGDVLKYTLFFGWSSVITTPGTLILRLRWGGVGGVVLALSGSYAPDPTAGSTSLSGWVEYYMVCRSTGTAGSAFTMGRMNLSDFDDASATTLKGNLDMNAIPVSAAAPVAIDTTIAKALSPTAQFSVATSPTNLTNYIALLESLN
jgi:hypothetical protein